MAPEATKTARAALMAALTAVLAQVAIPLPFSPVPVTLQVAGVLLAGQLLPPGTAAGSQAAYLLMGVVGLPVFAGGSAGPEALVGPTGGYLWGFALAAPVVAWVARALRGKAPSSRRRAFGAALLAGLSGVAIIYATGVTQLAAVTGMPLPRALLAGVVPFIGLDLAKAAGAALVSEALRHAAGDPSGAPAPAPRG